MPLLLACSGSLRAYTLEDLLHLPPQQLLELVVTPVPRPAEPAPSAPRGRRRGHGARHAR